MLHKLVSIKGGTRVDAFKQWNLPQPQSKMTNVLLEELVERKNAEIQFKGKSQFYGYVLSCLLLGIGCLLWYELEKNSSLFVNGFSPSLMPFFMLMVSLSIVAYFQLRKIAKKCKKAEEEFESLRLEILDRSDELFEGQLQWQNRHAVFKYLKDQHEINLYYK